MWLQCSGDMDRPAHGNDEMPTTSVDPRQLQTLFEAFGKDDAEQFVRAAEAIIQGELSANHHGQASALRQALRKHPPVRPPPYTRSRGGSLSKGPALGRGTHLAL